MQAALNIIGEDLKLVEQQFRKDLQSDVPLIRKVGEYVLSSGGKRVRPALLLLAARVSGYTGNQAVPLASVMAGAELKFRPGCNITVPPFKVSTVEELSALALPSTSTPPLTVVAPV